MLFGILGASLLGDILACKGMKEQEKGLLELVMDLKSKTRVVNTTSSFNTKILK